jgi:hypothetical protein
MRDVLGVNHINVLYTLTEKGALNEGADAILEMGSRTVKLTMREEMAPHYRHWAEWPKVTSVATLAEHPLPKELFGKPFTTSVIVAFRPGRPVCYQVPGLTPEDIPAQQDAFHALTGHFLTQYRRSGKTFVLQDWEGDWVLTNPPLDMDRVAGALGEEAMR